MGPLSSLPGRGPLVRAAGDGRSLLLRLPHQHPTGDQPTNRYPLQPSPCPGLPLSPGSLCGLPVSAPTLSAVPLPKGKHQHVLPSSQPSGDKVGTPPSGAHCCPDLDQLSCQPSSALPALEPRLSSTTRGSLRCPCAHCSLVWGTSSSQFCVCLNSCSFFKPQEAFSALLPSAWFK